ncbi:hypothetical protein ACWD33_09320 [Streptomyces xiamenensis]|jgi:hypothetical protein|uniref:Uncharacterized protein n=1 Tax=Streptomyces xiamenensis TaxID=408015 RepID=A0A0F7FQM3_9ACTN|nr:MULTISPECIES: hypothetical protein [Streptomyces]AKG41772.1 hypothetical protein SXIM_03880 [Streptomyces xiamenensis]MCU4749653.1 hypothetical protein [Streptomyces sp. G-5]QQN81224.1 hypothetical protein IPZ77_26355 [Streptomyces sp. XC 2026]
MAHFTGEQHAPDPPIRPDTADRPAPDPGDPEARGCLFALSQPPLILFLTVIGVLLLVSGVYDRFWL